jgi:FkbM family methyltransferase
MGCNFRRVIKSCAKKILLPRDPEYRPYIKELPIRNCRCRFFYGTREASEWYDPLKPYAILEYEWVVENVNLENQNIIDAGSHHGQYSVLFAAGSGNTSDIVSVDPVQSNCALTEVNMVLNGAVPRVVNCAVYDREGYVNFSNDSNGKILKGSGLKKKAKRLPQIMSDATIIKLDVEGAEYKIIPDQIDEMASAHTWIVEIHPHAGGCPSFLINVFREKGYDIKWVNREGNIVEPYPSNAKWNTHTTIFATRK